MSLFNVMKNSLNYIFVKYSYENDSKKINITQNTKYPIKYIVYQAPLLNKIFYIPTDKLYYTGEKTYQPIKSWQEIYKN